MTSKYSPNIDESLMPDRIRMLPIDPVRNIPVPFFVSWVDGKPEFRAADARKRVKAVCDKLCWVCGQTLGRYLTFVTGPMCCATRTSSEPPCHRECALFSARFCPFLNKPHMVRREGGLPEETQACAGEMIERNPGCTGLWTCKDYHCFPDGNGGWLIQMGEPERIEWYAEGRPATREEVARSVESGLPILMEMAAAEGSEAVEDLLIRKAWLEGRYPRE